MLDIDNIRPFLNASPNGYLILRPDSPVFTIVEANRALCDMLGMECADLAGLSVFKAFKGSGEYYEKGVRVMRDCLSRVLLLKTSQKCALQRYDVPTEQGYEVRFWTYEISPLLDDNNEVTFLIQHVVDVTENVRMEAEEKALDPLINEYPDAVGSMDLVGNFLSANRALLELTECSREELLRRSFVPFVAPEDFARVFSCFQRTLRGDIQKFEAHVIGMQQTRQVVSVTTMPIKVNQDVIGVQFVGRNISNLRKAEKQLEQYHRRLANIMESIRDGFFAVDRNQNIEYWNTEAERLLGVEMDDAVGKNLLHVLPIGAFPKFYASQQRATNERIPVRYEAFFESAKRWMEVSIFPSSNGLSVFFKDVTERVETERALEASEQRFRALVQNGSDVISILDKTGTYLYMSPSARLTFGIDPNFWVGRNVFEFVHPDDLDRVKGIMDHVRPGKEIRVPPFRFRRDGQVYRWIETVITDMSDDPAVGGLVANTQDVNERVEYIQAIEEQNKKLRDIAFIQSHIVRAPLVRIKGLADVICNHERDPAEVRILLNLMNEATEELDNVIREIVGKTDNL